MMKNKAIKYLTSVVYKCLLLKKLSLSWGSIFLIIGFTLIFITSIAQVSVTVDFNQEGRTYSKYIFGKNNSLSSNPGDPLSEADWKKLEDSGITIFRENGGNNSTKYNWRRKISSHPDWYNNVYSQSWDFKANSLADRLPDRLGIFGLQLIGKAAKTNEYNFNDWEYNNSQWWEGVHQNLAGGGIVDPNSNTALVDGDPDLYLMDWPADSTTEILKHWFDPNELGLNKDQFMYWCMDNEPSIWNGTHDDIGTDEETVEDYLQKYFAVAKAARAIFPNIKLMGPIFANEWQWYIWHDMRIQYDGRYYSSLEYFIKRIGEEQEATGIRLLDVLTLHFYPGNQNVEDVVQFHRVFFDEDYLYPDANGTKTLSGGWDESINKEYIFKRALDWMDEHIGADHGVGLGISETGVAISNQNGVAVWYASTLGEFMKHNVELFTPWSWQPAMWEVVNLFTEYSKDLYYDASSTNELLVSAYTTSDETKENITSILVNRSVDSSKEITLRVNGIYIDPAGVSAHQLSNLSNSETFISDAENTLTEVTASANYQSITVSLPPLSIVALDFNTTDEVITGLRSTIVENHPKIFPNPMKDGLLNIDFNSAEIDYLNVISFDGKIIKTFTKPNDAIDLSKIACGLYIIQLGSNKNIFEEKLVIH